MPQRKPEPPRKSDGELSASNLDRVSGGVSSGPDVCKLATPTPAGPTPTPYPNGIDVVKAMSGVLKQFGL
jgi:hypothetical protein